MTNPNFPLPLILKEVPGEFGFTGKQIYRLGGNFQWRDVIVPMSFKTDLASVPGAMQERGYKKAAVIHDYLCKQVRKSLGTYAWADRALFNAMRDDGAPYLVAYTYWAWVRGCHIVKNGSRSTPLAGICFSQYQFAHGAPLRDDVPDVADNVSRLGG